MDLITNESSNDEIVKETIAEITNKSSIDEMNQVEVNETTNIVSNANVDSVINVQDKNEKMIMDESTVEKDCINSTNSSIEDPKKKVTQLFFEDKRTPLEKIALHYDSSEDDVDHIDSVNENKLNENPNTQNYRNCNEVVHMSDSSDSESDSSTSSSSDDDLEKNSDIDCSDETDDEDNSKKKNKKSYKQPTTENIYEDLPPIEDLEISVPEVLCDPLGIVGWFVKEVVIVCPKPDKPTLNSDTVLFIDKGQKVLGRICEVFGPVKDPHYSVRFNSSEHIEQRGIKKGMLVYYSPGDLYTTLVFLKDLEKIKPVDDLGEDDPPQFSDDEEERKYWNSLKNKDKTNEKKTNDKTVIPNKRHRGNQQQVWQSNHPWNSNRNNQMQQMSTRPFYRSHHPWSRPRHPQINHGPWPPSQQYQPQEFIQQANWASAYSQAYSQPQYHTYVNPQAYQSPQQNYYRMRFPTNQIQNEAVSYQQINPNSFNQNLPQSQVNDTQLLPFSLVPPPPPPAPGTSQND